MRSLYPLGDTVRRFRASDGKALAELSPGPGYCGALVLAKDGESIEARSMTGSVVRFWLSTNALLRHLCANLNEKKLTPEEWAQYLKERAIP
jgi:hypothetical protein